MLKFVGDAVIVIWLARDADPKAVADGGVASDGESDEEEEAAADLAVHRAVECGLELERLHGTFQVLAPLDRDPSTSQGLE